MEASVDHMAREASSVRRYPSSLPSRAAWSCLTEGSGLSGMVRSTLHAERTCRQSEIPAFFGETIQFTGQQGEAGLLDQGHFPAASADVAKVYVYGDQGLPVDRRFSDDRPPGINDVRVAPEDQVVLFSDSIDEDNVALEHTGVEAGDPTPVAPCVQQLGIRVGATGGGDNDLDEAVIAKPLLGHVFGQLAIDVDLRVQLLQLLCGQFLGDGREDLLDLRILIQYLLVHRERRVVEGEEPLAVRDELETKTLDTSVGREHLAEVTLVALVGGLVDQTLIYLDDVVAWELEVVSLLHPWQAVVTRGELGSHADSGFIRVLFDELLEVGEVFDTELVVDLLAHGDGVGVVGRRRRFQPHYAVLLEVFLGHGFELLLATRYGVRVAQVGDPTSPRVLPGHVDLT